MSPKFKRPQDLLPKKLKFKKFPANKRREAMALSLPINEHSPTYVCAPLARLLASKGIDRVHILTDLESEAIALQPVRGIDDKKGSYKIVQTGDRGSSLNARLRKVMPHGRYAFMEDESDDNVLVFRREKIFYKGKGVKDGEA